MAFLRSMLLNSTAILRAPDDGNGSGTPPPKPPASSEKSNNDPADGSPPAAKDDAAGATGAGDGDDDGAGADDEAGDDDGDGEVAAAAGDLPAKKPAPDWRDREISKKHGKLKATERELADTKQRLADAEALLSRQPKKDGDDGEPATRAPARAAAEPSNDDAVREAAERIVAKNTFDGQLQDLDKSGHKAFGKDKWEEACKNLALVGGIPLEDMQHILASDDPSKVFYELGENPEKFQELQDLPAARRAAEYVKMGFKAPTGKPKPKLSEAPEPVEEVRGGGNNSARSANNLYDDKRSDDDWHKQRDKEREANLARKRGGSRAA